jgi:phosphoglycerol transferase MdoB-like AlkP superfamily enzyme
MFKALTHILKTGEALIFPATTGAAIMLKSILLLGLILDTDHVQLLTRAGPRETWWNFPFHFGFIALFISLGFLFKNRARLGYLIGLNLLISILFILDILYYRGFSAMPSPQTLSQTANLKNLSASILPLVSPVDFLFILDLPLLLGGAFFIPSWSRNAARRPGLCIALVLSCILLLVWRPIQDVREGKNLKFTTYSKYNSTFTCRVMSPIGYHLHTLYTAWSDSRRLRLTSRDRAEIQTWFAQNQEHLPDTPHKGRFKGMNLLIIQVESLEAFIINQSVNKQEITPTLNRLLKNSLYFSGFYEQINEGMSSDADLMTNTSIYPIRTGSSFFLFPHTLYPSLPRVLNAKGYSTLAVEPDEGSFWNWVAAQRSIGFENCMDITRFKNDEIVNLGLSDASFLRQLAPVILAQKKPFYTFTCTLTSHTPFILPPEHQELTLPESLSQTYLGGYFQSLHYTDKHLGIFLDTLDRAGLMDNTVVALYGDHEGVHKYLNKQVSEVQPSEPWWQNNHKRLPFLIYQKHLSGELIETVGGQIDIFPTLAYLMGLDEAQYADTVMGRNLLKTSRNFALLRDGTVIGQPADSTHETHIRKGLDVADRIIRGNYFRQ